MGYSSRYHAASLAAVFLALAIGILIGVGFGDDVVSGTSRSLEESLQDDLADARSEADDLAAELGRERDFGESVYPALVGDRLPGDRVAVVAIGGLPEDLSQNVEDGLGPTGARLAKVAVVRYPPDAGALAGSLEDTRFARLERDPDLLEDLGRVAGRQLVTGGRLLSGVREQLLSRFSGTPGRVDDVVLARDVPEDLDPAEQEAADRLEAGLLEGMRESGVPVVAVERSDDEESSVPVFDSHGIPTVDDLDLVSGRVAMVFVLLGAEGNFGVKGTADQLLPDLLVPGARGGP
jgi:Copper transport outer membrane protein, MctB